MKILMLGWELPPYNSGGLGVVCYHLCKALAKRDVDIDFILPYTAEHKNIDFMKVRGAYPFDAHTVMSGGIAYDSYKYVRRDGSTGVSSIYDLVHEYERVIDKIIDKTEYDVIHAHDWLTFRAGLRAKQITGRPLFVHVHSLESDRAASEGGGNPLVREIEGMTFMMADKIIAISDWTKQAIIREYGIPEDKIEVVHNSIDASEIEPLDPDNSYKYLEKLKNNGYKVLVNVGRLTIQKGLVNLFYAMRAVVDKQPKTILLIVGSGEQYLELMQLAADLGISQHILFTGFQRGKKWRDAYAIGDLFLMPSVSEPFGLTALEAIGYGTPSLISKQSGVSEVMQNALKVDFWDINEMANQIINVVRSDALRVELHRNALHEYNRLSWGHSADKLLGLYRVHLKSPEVIS